MIKVVGISFYNANRIYYFSPGNLDIHENDKVIVETERGVQYGTAVTDILDMPKEKVFLPLRDVVRLANEKDEKTNEKNNKDAEKALSYAKKLVEEEDIEMKLFEASYTFDRKKLIFKFIADERVDFRELAKKLAAKYKTRIELRQIGVRDKAKEVDGIGPCGRRICCAAFLKDLDTVSINMAKNQNISLNPSKINGACGRLMCCLKYEDENYIECRKKMKKIGDKIKTPHGMGTIQGLDILRQKYKVEVPDHGIVEVDKN